MVEAHKVLLGHLNRVKCMYEGELHDCTYVHATREEMNICLFFFQEPTAIPSREEKKGGGCATRWCVRRGSLLQDCLLVKFQDTKCKHEIFVRIDNEAFKLFQSEIVIKLFVVCQKLSIIFVVIVL